MPQKQRVTPVKKTSPKPARPPSRRDGNSNRASPMERARSPTHDEAMKLLARQSAAAVVIGRAARWRLTNAQREDAARKITAAMRTHTIRTVTARVAAVAASLHESAQEELQVQQKSTKARATGSKPRKRSPPKPKGACLVVEIKERKAFATFRSPGGITPKSHALMSRSGITSLGGSKSLRIESEFSGEGTYTGECVDGRLPRREGRGRMCFLDGRVYEGEWHSNQMHGRGEMLYASGNRYVGSFRHGMRDGDGTLLYSNGDEYRGGWVQDAKEGLGTFHWAAENESYVGDFRKGAMHGRGVYTFADGSSYKGAYVDGQRQGRGVLRLPDGTWQKGEWAGATEPPVAVGDARTPTFRPELAFKPDARKMQMEKLARAEATIESIRDDGRLQDAGAPELGLEPIW